MIFKFDSMIFKVLDLKFTNPVDTLLKKVIDNVNH